MVPKIGIIAIINVYAVKKKNGNDLYLIFKYKNRKKKASH